MKKVIIRLDGRSPLFFKAGLGIGGLKHRIAFVIAMEMTAKFKGISLMG